MQQKQNLVNEQQNLVNAPGVHDSPTFVSGTVRRRRILEETGILLIDAAVRGRTPSKAEADARVQLLEDIPEIHKEWLKR